MKLLILILGILFTLTSESYSKGNEELEVKPSQSGQKESLTPQELAKRTSRKKSLPTWFWGNGKVLSPSELLYLEADLETPVEDWFWDTGKPLTTKESVAMPGQLTFPNWIKDTGTPITHPPEKKIAPPSREQIYLTADHMTHDKKRDMVWAWGKVVIRFPDKVLRADKIKVDNKTGDGKAIGNVIITQKDGTRLRSQKALFNMNNEQGRFFTTRGKLGKNYYIKGKKITRYSENHFKVKKAHLTTCAGSLPDWTFESETMDILVGDRALFTKGVFKVRGVPILYLPVGYVPIATDRKSGLLFPEFGQSNLDGVTLNNAYYWAINGHSDATFRLGYQGRRGFKPGIEYRYTPNGHTRGSFNTSFINDKLNRSTFWKIDASHEQLLPYGFEFDGILDLESEEFNRNFEDNTAARSRRSSESRATITKTWDNSTLDILTRYRNSTDISSDQTFAELPQVTYKVPKYVLGDSDFYINLDTSFTSFLTDLDTTPDVDDNFSVQRFDFHPQISYPMNIAPWLSFTPTIGARETVYSKGLDETNNNKRLDFFTRESFDVTARFEGPRIEKIYTINNKYIPKVKHLLEPRLTYSYIPDVDENDREKIKILDGIDSVNRQSTVSYSLTQRLLQKELENNNSFSTREILRFDISQSFNLIEATGEEKPDDKQPFSDIRFDLDSRLTDFFEFNADTTFDIYNDVFKVWNFEVGVKPLDSLYLSLERRYVRRGDVFTIASLDWEVKEGWRLQASTRLDELTNTNRENHLTLVYDDPCRCWGFNFDFIKRNNFRANTAVGTNETKLFLGITFRGLGSIASGAQNILELHRTFESIYEPKDPE
jgi:LPS-assembly protein